MCTTLFAFLQYNLEKKKRIRCAFFGFLLVCGTVGLDIFYEHEQVKHSIGLEFHASLLNFLCERNEALGLNKCP